MYRTNTLFKCTGGVDKKKYPPNKGTQKLTEIDKFLCLELVIDKPGIYLTEIRQELVEQTGTDVNESTICRFLHASGFTRQRMITTATQRSDQLRCEYLSDMSIYQGHPELFVFVDETGTDRRDIMRKFAYSIRGKPATVSKLMVRGQRVSDVVGISNDGVLDFITSKSTNTRKVSSDQKRVANCLVTLPIPLEVDPGPQNCRYWSRPIFLNAPLDVDKAALRDY